MKKLFIAMGVASSLLLASCGGSSSASANVETEVMDLTKDGLAISVTAPKGAKLTKDAEMEDFTAEIKKDNYEVSVEFLPREEAVDLAAHLKSMKDATLKMEGAKILKETNDGYFYSRKTPLGDVYKFEKYQVVKGGIASVSCYESEEKDQVEAMFNIVNKSAKK